MNLITGITGQVGSHLAKRFLPGQVVGVVRRTATDNLARLRYHGILDHPNLKLVTGDVTDYPSLYRIIKEYKPERIWHCAASSQVGMSFDTPVENLNITGGGTANLLEAVRNNLSEDYNPIIVQYSSSEMLGSNFSCFEEYRTEHSIDTPEGKEVYSKFPEKCWQDEKTPLSANSPYAAAKIYAHNMALLYKRAYGMRILPLICFNMEGETRGHNFVTMKIVNWVKEFVKWKKEVGDTSTALYKDFIVKCTDNAVRFPKLRLGNMYSQRDWIYVEDAIDAALRLIGNNDLETACICTGETRTIHDFAREAFGHIGIDRYADYIVIDPAFYRPVEVPMLKGKSRINCQKTSFQELVRRMMC